MDNRITYFEKGGKQNTVATLEIARDRATQLGIDQIVVASSHGYTARKAREAFADPKVRIIAVGICASFEEEGWVMTAEERKAIEGMGVTVLTSTHSLGDGVSDAFNDDSPNRIVRETLYRFCPGMKVAVEVALMAADAGMLDMTREIIAVGGTSEGADTALVLKPAFSRRFKELEIREILSKPRNLS